MSSNIHYKISKTLQQLIRQNFIDSYELIPTDTHLLKIRLHDVDAELTYTYLGLIDMDEREIFDLFKNDIQRIIENNILEDVKKMIQ